MYAVKEMIENRKLSRERPRVEEVWCQRQIDDFQQMVGMVENLIATAVASNSSPHQYTMMEEAKAQFLNEFLNMAERYRRLQPE